MLEKGVLTQGLPYAIGPNDSANVPPLTTSWWWMDDKMHTPAETKHLASTYVRIAAMCISRGVRDRSRVT